MNVRCPQCGAEGYFPDNQLPPPQTPIQCPRCTHIYYLYRPQPTPIYTVPVKPSRKGWWIAGILVILLFLAGSLAAAVYFGYNLFRPLLKMVAAIQEEYPQAGAQINLNTRQGETILLIKYRTELDIIPETLKGELGEEMARIAAIAYDTYRQEKPGKKIDYITVCAGKALGDDPGMSAENCLTFEANKAPSLPQRKAPKSKPAPPQKKIPRQDQTNI